MRHVIQKIQISSLLVALVGALLAVPILASEPVFAAKTQPKGTCFYQGPDGKKTKSCKSLDVKTSQKDTDGNKVSYDNCYSVTATTSSETITRVNCDGSSLTKPKQMCTDSSGKNVDCVTCKDGSFVADTADCPVADTATTSGNCASVSKCDLITKYVNPFINFLAALVGVAVVISIIIGGIQYGSSAGDPQKVSAAKNRIRNAIVALVTFLFLYALLNFLIPGGLL